MLNTRSARVALALAAGTLTLAACGSSGGGGSSTSASGGPTNCATGSLKASGSSAQKNAITEWINTYQTDCPGSTIEYTANGSGAGITDFTNAQTDFAGSDSALKEEEQPAADKRCATGTALNIPMVGGAIALAYNLAGVDKLILNAEVTAGIFANAITTWDDPKIAALNPGVTLPSASIAQFHRSDSSGTTGNFTKWLVAAAGSAWTFDTGKEWKAPGGQGSKGSDQVLASVKSTPNSIGYVELSFVQDVAGIGAAWIDNGAGPVEPTSVNAALTISSAQVTGTGNNLSLKIDYATKTANAYPVVLVTYEITCEKGLAADQVALVKSFLTYTSGDAAQGELSAVGYVPITGDLLTKVRTAVASIS